MRKNPQLRKDGTQPENTLTYVNNGSISTVKGEQNTIYLDYVVLAQILPAANSPENLDTYQFKEDEVLLFIPLYNT